MIKKLFKNKKFIFLFSFILELIIFIVLKHIILKNNDISLEVVILSTISLMLGPFATLGVSFSSLICTLTLNPSLDALIKGIVNFIIYSTLGILCWKLWYSIGNKNNPTTPRFNSMRNCMKIALITIFYGLFLFTGIYETYTITHIKITHKIILFVILTIISLTFIPIFNYLEIPAYTPKKQFKKLTKPEFYDLILIIGCSILFIYGASKLNILIALSSIIIFLLKPYTAQIMHIKTQKLSLTEETINSAIKILILILIFDIIIIILRKSIDIFNQDYKISTLLFLSTIILFYILIIPLTIYIKYLEKNITKPIHNISKTAKKIDKLKSFDEIKNEFLELETKNELGILTDSMINLIKTVENYSEELKIKIAHKEKYKTERKLANDIQMSMISTEFDEFTSNKNIEIYGYIKPAKDIGGDFYDFFTIDEDNIGFVIGDVSGKGIPAALFMVKTMTTIKDYLKHEKDPSKTFNKVNNNLCENNKDEFFVTSYLGKLNIKTGKLTYINAGHNQPLININKKYEYLTTKPNLVLAAMENTPYKKHELQLKKGDSILLYTDGITEANNNYQEFYGENRLKNIVNKNKDKDIKTIINEINNDVNKFCDNEQYDDTTLFILKFKGIQ